MSCNIISWFKDNYEETENSEDILLLREIYKIFKTSDYYIHLISSQKRKYNLTYFKNFFIKNTTLSKYYIERRNNTYTFLEKWKKKEI